MDSSMATNEQAAWIVKIVAFPSHVQINEKILLGRGFHRGTLIASDRVTCPADAHPVLIAPRKGKVEEGGKKKARKVLLCHVLRPFHFSSSSSHCQPLGPLPVCLGL